MKLNFRDLLTFSPVSNYRITSDWRFIEEHLKHWSEPGSAIVNLEPDFQRLHVWTLDQQTKYIEYILSGGMSGRELYFNCVGWMGTFKGPFVIVDGKQRLEAVRKFMRNEVSIFNGHYYKDIDGRLPPNASFIICVNDLKTEAEVIKWYLEMNTGGTPHTSEEIQKAKELLEKAKKS